MYLQYKQRINYSIFKSYKINGKILTNERGRNRDRERLRLMEIFFRELINLDRWSLTAGWCKRRKIKYSLQFEKPSIFLSLLANDWLRKQIGPHFCLALLELFSKPVSHLIPIPIFHIYSLPFNQFIPHVSISSHLSISSFSQ